MAKESKAAANKGGEQRERRWSVPTKRAKGYAEERKKGRSRKYY